MLTGTPRTILLVEDEPLIAIEESAMIRRFGYEVATASTGEKAVQVALTRPEVCLVLMDIDLGPGLNGAQTATTILESRAVPIVFLTSNNEGAIVDAARVVTHYGYVAKGSAEPVLHSSIELALELFETRQGLRDESRERAHAEEALEEEAARRRILFEQSPDGMLIIDPLTARFEEFNTAAHRQLGYTREEFAILSIADVDAKESPGEVQARIADALNKGEADFETLHRTRTGELRNVDVKIQIVTFRGRQVYYTIWRDITERIRVEEANTKLLAEKVLVLREVHHRIKNNMTMVQSLLSLQASAVRDASARSALEDAKERVQSMMLLYDRLYRSDNFNELPIDEYLGPLLKSIVGAFPRGSDTTLETRLESFMMDAKRLASIGMIVNELLTNIMKYAFEGRSAGRVIVSATRQDRRVTISVADDGVGLPSSVDPGTASGFGLQLVRMLTQQLNGTMRLERAHGTQWILQFGE